jgi:ribose transport system substrate-binding protein
MIVKKLFLAAFAAALVGPFGSSQAADKKTLVFVPNSSTNFWRPAEAGVRKAQSELPNYKLVFKYPKHSSPEIQTRILDDFVAAGATGIVVSPIDAISMVDTIDRIAGQVTLFTTDSDAPTSKRVAYFGSSNSEAGKQAGQLLLKALPNGGKCIGFIGLLGAGNAGERIEGVKDSLKGSKIDLIDVLADNFDKTRAKRNVADVLTAHSEVNCMVGFYDYNTPLILEALREAGKLERVTVVAFDADPITLAGVKDGTIVGTIVQQPFEWAYLSMTAMAKYLDGVKSMIPPDRRIILPTRTIDRSNVEAFWTELKAVLCCMPTAREISR